VRSTFRPCQWLKNVNGGGNDGKREKKGEKGEKRREIGGKKMHGNLVNRIIISNFAREYKNSLACRDDSQANTHLFIIDL
jgi:hypothetical protein